MYHRTGQWCPGVRTDDNVVAYDVQILPQWQAIGRPTVDRCFVLPDEGVQVDLLLPPVSVRYEVLDLDEFADAMESGSVDLATAIRVLRNTQRFIDKRLRNLDQDVLTGWPDFPPATVLELAELPAFVG